jgi:hypothetical protein
MSFSHDETKKSHNPLATLQEIAIASSIWLQKLHAFKNYRK